MAGLENQGRNIGNGRAQGTSKTSSILSAGFWRRLRTSRTSTTGFCWFCGFAGAHCYRIRNLPSGPPRRVHSTLRFRQLIKYACAVLACTWEGTLAAGEIQDPSELSGVWQLLSLPTRQWHGRVLHLHGDPLICSLKVYRRENMPEFTRRMLYGSSRYNPT